jgi:hypothetical protein
VISADVANVHCHTAEVDLDPTVEDHVGGSDSDLSRR